ncbi:uncharacterized protein SPSK_06896 [Sporothrix schenckii 1099-18]|uniref:J domain-containing protein n=1 Tax=Sporothrix schenckii 1099-18 TaxID=1397361 RepID=A0A0F2MGQ1_SPOSC|nr:uncharacterized protein SPSK_06896 [Sporothrix schenckii 1099-18]KJR88812.1 hypothetical protein SPSK_06896 [Sporothrix schenckii 1099-18]
MAKADYSRDYYADLELPASADVNEIKKQFRKLALKYHPDRNPGKEAEVNAKFQTIQAAHEILTSPEQKSKYDSHRSRNASRYPGASGVRGNPWQDVSSQYPVPPRRPGQAPTSAARNTHASSSGPSSSSASSSHRYSSFNVPPSAKTSKEDLDSRYNAWKNMRPNAAKGRPGQSASAAYAAANSGSAANTSRKANANPASSSMPPPPPPHPPQPQTPMPARTASQRQKANASFGTSTRRPTGFHPQSQMGDEPPAANTNNYFTNRTHTSRGYFFGEQPDPPSSTDHPTPEPRRASASAASEPAKPEPRNLSDESLFDSRQSTPYQTHGGEKFNPFDGVRMTADLNRTKSYRSVNPQAARPDFRRRSSSLPDESDNATKAAASAKKRAAGGGTGATTSAAAAGAAAGVAAGVAYEAAAASHSPSANSANTGVPRSSARSRSGPTSKASRPATSSQMPQFEEQYQRMQGDQQQQQQEQQEQRSNHFASVNNNAAQNTGNPHNINTPQNDKSKPILYATPPFSQDPKQASYMSAKNVPSRACSDGIANAQRQMASRKHIISWFHFNSHTPPESDWPEPKRRASHPTESSSGDPSKNDSKSFNSGYMAGMNAFEAKQFNIIQGLVDNVEVYKPSSRDSKSESKAGHAKSAGHAVPRKAAAVGREYGLPEDGGRNRFLNAPVPSCSLPQVQFFTSDLYRPIHANGATRTFSSNLSLDDDVFSVPSTPSDQERTNPFTRSSVEDINTRFVSGEKANAAWAFSAGGSEGESYGDFPSRVRRSQSGSRLGRRSPGKGNSIPKPDGSAPQPPPPPPRPQQVPTSQDPSPVSSTIGTADGDSGKTNDATTGTKGNTTTTTNYFNAGRWAEQIGSEHFVPWTAQQPPNLPPRQSTPTQQRARPIKKPKPIQRSNTTAPREYIVIPDDDDDEEGGGSTAENDVGHKTQQQSQQQPIEVEADVSGFASPTAMDIDSPPATETTFHEAGPGERRSGVASSGTDTAGGAPLSSPNPHVEGARKIPVEPTRPEWRAGDVNKPGTASTAAAAADAAAASAGTASAPRPVPNAGADHVRGSEDSEEFRATLSDIHKVEPFAENAPGIQGYAGTGLGSFGDLQSNLPFESKAASAAVPVPPSSMQGGGSSAARVARSRSRSRKNITFPKAPVAPHPPAALGVPGLQPTAAAWDKYVTEFRHYMLEWTAFNSLYVDHFQARRHDIETRDGDFGWLDSADGDNDGINRYLDWMEQDAEVRAVWSVSCSNHDMDVRKFMAYRERMRLA